MSYLKFLLVVAFLSSCYAAPRPIDWDAVGKKIKEIGSKSVDVAKNACRFVNTEPIRQDLPQFQGFQPSYYPPPTGVNPYLYPPNYQYNTPNFQTYNPNQNSVASFPENNQPKFILEQTDGQEDPNYKNLIIPNQRFNNQRANSVFDNISPNNQEAKTQFSQNDISNDVYNPSFNVNRKLLKSNNKI